MSLTPRDIAYIEQCRDECKKLCEKYADKVRMICVIQGIEDLGTECTAVVNDAVRSAPEAIGMLEIGQIAITLTNMEKSTLLSKHGKQKVKNDLDS